MNQFLFAAHANKPWLDRRLDFSNLMEQLSPAIKNSCRISPSENSPKMVTRSVTSSFTVANTESIMRDDVDKENNAEVLLKTPALGNSSMTSAPRISFRKAQSTSDCSNSTDSPKSRKAMQRRNVEKNDASDTPKAKTSLTFGEISAQSFYGTSNVEPHKRTPIERVPIKVTRKREKRPAPSRRSQDRRTGARKPILGSIRKLNHKFKAKKVTKVDAVKKRSQLLDRIEKAIESSSLTTYFKDLQANNFDKQLIGGGVGRPTNILKESAESPNKSISLRMDDDSDAEQQQQQLLSELEESDQEEEEPTKRKFFKSKSRKSENRYQVAKGISATVKRGHGIKLLSPPKKKQKLDNYDELLSIQQEVQSIVKLLASTEDGPSNSERKTDAGSNEMIGQSDQTSKCDTYRRRIPHNTIDPNEIKRQETVLDILIDNGICNEENFKIFISEYDSHKVEAETILNNLFDISVSADDEMWVSQDEGMDIPMENESATVSDEKREFHPIFYKDRRRSEVKKDLLSVPMPKPFKWIPISDKQLQIDAGQKEFGSKTCSECGMFYTMHDPEDEILHQKFHNNMMGVLNFKVS